MIATDLGTFEIDGEWVFVQGVLDTRNATRTQAMRLQGMLFGNAAKPDSPTQRLIEAASHTGWQPRDKFLNLLFSKFEFQVWWHTLRNVLMTDTKLVTLAQQDDSLWEGSVMRFTPQFPHSVQATEYMTDVEIIGKKAKRLILPLFTVNSKDEALFEPVVQQALELHFGLSAS